MAKDRLKFYMDLVEKVSGPSSRINKSIERLQRGFDSFGRLTKKVGVSKEMANLSRFAAKAVGPVARLGQVAHKTGERFLNFAKSKKDAFVSHAQSLAGFAVAGAGYAVDMLAFKEGALSAMATFLGSQSEADSLYNQTIDLAKAMRVPGKEALEGVNQLLGAGFKAKDAMDVFKGALDLKALKGADIKALSTILGQIKAKGKLQTEELLQLAESGGLAIDKVYASIGRLKNIDGTTEAGRTQIGKLLEGGKIDAETGIKAALGAIQSMTRKGLGEYAASASNSMGALIEGFKDLPNQFILRMNASKAIEPFKKALSGIITALDPATESGQKIMAVFEKIAASVGGMIAGVDIGALVKNFVSLVEVLWDAISAFGGGFWEGLKAGIEPMIEIFGAVKGSGSSLVDGMRVLGRVAGFALASLAMGATMVASAVGWLSDNWKIFAGVIAVAFAPLVLAGTMIYAVLDAVFAFLAGVLYAVTFALEAGKGLGTAIIDGIIFGLKHAAGTLKNTWNSIVSILPDTVSSTLQIASPSRVMFNKGVNTVEGWTGGLRSKQADNDNAIDDVFGVPNTSAPSASGGFGAGRGGGGAQTVTITLHITVVAGAGVSPAEAAATGNAVGRAAASTLADTFGASGIAVGG